MIIRVPEFPGIIFIPYHHFAQLLHGLGLIVDDVLDQSTYFIFQHGSLKLTVSRLLKGGKPYFGDSKIDKFIDRYLATSHAQGLGIPDLVSQRPLQGKFLFSDLHNNMFLQSQHIDEKLQFLLREVAKMNLKIKMMTRKQRVDIPCI